MRTLTWLVLAAALTTLVTALQAGSIWEKSRHAAKALHTDDTARSVGDTITISIEEKSSIANETKRDNDKNASRTASLSGSATVFKKDDTKGTLHSLPTINYASAGETKFVGDAKFNSDRSVTDNVTVTVQDVLANGNLVVLGTRERNMHGDVEVIEISGIVRPSDINYNNIVGSEKIADFHVVYRHKGQENDVTNPGWLAHLLNLTSPY
jgi:flagellar L-ring protein precursor FlgH